MTIVILAILLLSTASIRAQQADTKETAARLGKGFAELSAWIEKAAEMVPADKFGYKPVPTVRTFGELLGHIADGSDFFCGRAAGKQEGSADNTTVVPNRKEALDACSAAHRTGHLGMLIQNFGHSTCITATW